MTAAPRMLTIAEVAQRLAVSQRTVRRLIDDGELDHHRLGPRTIRVAERDLADYLSGTRRARRERQRVALSDGAARLVERVTEQGC